MITAVFLSILLALLAPAAYIAIGVWDWWWQEQMDKEWHEYRRILYVPRHKRDTGLIPVVTESIPEG